ncbi:MAG: TonB C-terminal domain-containing protein [Sulfurimonas sp.]|nr:TonB C-terminal domain-containing protein [Sulfurimonas sp.]MDQ7062492.1 TonB C-terminal domain-containing protein [Sulfurimonas sp.]
MDRSNPYFLVSGFISLSLFTLFLSLFFYMMFSSTKINTFALNKDNFISISLETVVIPTKKANKVPVIKKEEAKAAEEVKEVDIGNLFSDVWTKDIKIKKVKEKKVDNKRLELIQKKIKKSENNSVQSVEEVVKNEQAKVIDEENKKSSSGDEVNEYLAKIQGLVYKYFEPPANSQGHKVTVIIELSAYGKILDFRILKYSENQALNKECDMIKDRLMGILFPSNPQNKSFSLSVDLISDK